MKTDLIKKIFSALTLFAAFMTHAHAVVITSQFTDLGSSQWSVDLAVHNDSDVGGINEFTVYFSQTYFSNVTVLASPAAWDSLVAQPDLALAAPGFFDSFNALGLALGEVQDGFKIGFTLLGQGMPEQLPFDILDSNFVATSSGTTVAASTAVPEPATGLLLLAGCLALALKRGARKGVAA